MTGTLVFDPLLPWPAIISAACAAAVLIGLALWRRLSGWWLRFLSLAVLVLALSGPAIQTEDRAALSDIVVVLVDESASQRIADRGQQTEMALLNLVEELEARPNTEIRVVRVGDGQGDSGTLAMTALAEALAEEPRARVAGAILITDGRVHDIERIPDLPAPLHTLLTGQPDDWDRRLIVENAPGFAIIDEEVVLNLRIEDQGMVPASQNGRVPLEISIDGGPPEAFVVPVGEDLAMPVTLTHGGLNVIQFSVPMSEGELTDRNNHAVVQINGVRDRLRVLLVSGEPHPGERTWRNLLKSDGAVDLVHFTILRPPEKQDGVPVTELSLIAFPTRELFLDKIDEFDLIIFDRYKRRGILPAVYLDNVRQYVEEGGAVLVAAGPDFATADSIYRSPLAEVLPAAPTARVIEQGYRPDITEIGARHPVTEGLDEFAPASGRLEDEAEDAPPGWGRWFRLIDLVPESGHTVMSALDARPLLVLDRVGEGRVALLASDHAWLWSRGYEGGGPQLELLRRLAHWMMKEPELEEEALTAEAEGQTMTITRRSLSEGVGDVTITGPDGAVTVLPMEEIAPGRFQSVFEAPEIGLYRLAEGDLESVMAVGPSAPREFEETVASGEVLSEAVAAQRGGLLALSGGVPDVRSVRPGRPAAGRGWIGITPREAYLTQDVTITPFIPPWLFLLIASALVIGAWLLEGRNGSPKKAA